MHDTKKKVYNLSEDLGDILAEEAAERKKKRQAEKRRNSMLPADSLSRGGDTLRVPKGK